MMKEMVYLETNEPGHEKMCLMPNANNKGADQPAHPRSLISAFVICCQDRMVPLACISEISRFYLVSVAEQVSLFLVWSETPEDTFCHDEAQMMCMSEHQNSTVQSTNLIRWNPDQRRTCIKNTQILLKNQHAATARLFLRKVSGIVVVYESGNNLTCWPISELKINTQVRKMCKNMSFSAFLTNFNT